MKSILLFLIFVSAIIFSGCTKSTDIGTEKNPLKFFLVPAQDILTLQETGKIIEKYLEKELELNVQVEIPTSYIAVVEAFGSKRADVAVLNTLGYIIARQKYGVEPKLKLVNRGMDEYYGQIITHKDGPKTVSELNGKKFAYVDPASTSGYLLPKRLFKSKNIKIGESLFAGRHDSVVAAVYQRKVDAGATFFVPADDDGTPKDARWLLRTQHPDVFDKIQIIEKTGPIPNDPLVLRKDIPDELKLKIVNAFLKYIKTDEGKKVLYDMYHITGFKPAVDADYDTVRSYLKDLNQSPEDFIKK